MIHHHAFNTAGCAQIRMLDLETGRTEVMDYANGAERFERHPERWRPADMSTEDHAVAVEAWRAELAERKRREEDRRQRGLAA